MHYTKYLSAYGRAKFERVREMSKKDLPGFGATLAEREPLDFEAATQRLVDNQKIHPQRGLKNIKAEELKAHNQKMGAFMGECKRRRGFAQKILDDPNEFVKWIDEYISTVIDIGLFPTLTGLCLFMDITMSTFQAFEMLGDERSAIIQKYRQFIGEYFNQSGLNSSTNPIFSIYYGKSVLGQSDNPTLTVNMNLTGSAVSRFDADGFRDMVEATPGSFRQIVGDDG